MCYTCQYGENQYFCGFCQVWVRYGKAHVCYPPITGTVNYTPFDEPLKHYKCPKCKGEFSEPVCKYEMGGTNSENTYHCPFCKAKLKDVDMRKEK